jgi:transcriptional regulator with XRE-family HTH domain
MRSTAAERIMAKASKEDEIFIRLYADIVVRINQVLKEKGMSQKDFAESMDKKPSEINKWLKGDHNFTLRSLAKVMAELDEVLLYVPKQNVFKGTVGAEVKMTVHRNKMLINGQFDEYKVKSKKTDYATAS